MWALVVFGGMAILFLLLLCIPVEVLFALDTHIEEQMSVRISWFYGIVKKDIRNNRKIHQTMPETGIKKKNRFAIFRSLVNKGNLPGLIKRSKKLFIDVYSQLEVGKITGDFNLGFEDPVYTGLVFAVINPLDAMFKSKHPGFDVKFQPSFYGEDIIEGNMQGSIRITPVKIVLPVFRFIISREFLNTVKFLIRSKINKVKE